MARFSFHLKKALCQWSVPANRLLQIMSLCVMFLAATADQYDIYTLSGTTYCQVLHIHSGQHFHCQDKACGILIKMTQKAEFCTVQGRSQLLY